MQFHSISNNFVHPNQLGGLKQYSITNTGFFLTYIIQLRQVKNILSSTLTFDIAQFFPSLNHCLLPLILDKAGFNPKVSKFFADYLIGRKTQYVQNNFFSPLFEVNVGVVQGSALSPILSALYLSPLFYIFEKHANNLKIPIFFLSFVDDGLLVSQEKSFEKTNSFLFYSYNIISFLLDQFDLVIKHGKTKVFHFSQTYGLFSPPILDISSIGGHILSPKPT